MEILFHLLVIMIRVLGWTISWNSSGIVALDTQF